MKNVAIIIAGLKGGGAERAVSNLTRNLSKDEFNVVLIVFDNEKIAYLYDGEMICIESKASNNPFVKIANFYKRYNEIKKIKKNYEIDAAISFLGGPNLLNVLTKRNEKTILSVRNYPSRKEKSIYSKLDKVIIRKLYNKADLIVGVSEEIKRDLVKNYNINDKKIRTIYNFFDLEEIQRLKNEKIEEEYEDIFSGNVIISVGRLTNFKGHWHLIKAFKEVVAYNNNWKLVIVGSGELFDDFKYLMKKLDLVNKVFLIGFQKNPYKYIAKSQMFILPSLTEGFPNVLVEAMATGVAVISSDCMTGPREILAPSNNLREKLKDIEYAKFGILVPVCDGKFDKDNTELSTEEKIMSEAIRKLIKSDFEKEKYKSAASSRALDFGKGKIIDLWEGIIKN